jgi:hypothetical protein
MPIESKLTRVDPDSIERCHGMARMGQCPYQRMPNSVFCPMHSGPVQERALSTQRKRAYQLSQWQARVDEHADNEEAKSLRGEIGILRITLEAVMGQCKSEQDLLMFAPRISDLVTRIEKVVVSCHRLEERTGSLLDKQTAQNLGATIVEIVSRHVTNEELLGQIGDEIARLIVAASPKEDT